jgi:hypothetical protein
LPAILAPFFKSDGTKTLGKAPKLWQSNRDLHLTVAAHICGMPACSVQLAPAVGSTRGYDRRIDVLAHQKDLVDAGRDRRFT